MAGRQLDHNKCKRVESYSRWFGFLKCYLEIGTNLAQVNVTGGEHDGFEHSVRRSQLPLWSRAAEIYCYYFNLKALISLLLQYNYDRAIHEYATSDTAPPSGDFNSSTSHSRQQIEAELARAIELVEILENPFYEAGEPFEILTIFNIHCMLIAYLALRIYNHLCGPIRVGVARLFLDPKLERELMLKNELMPLIDNFVASSVNYLAAIRHKLVRSHLELSQLPESIESISHKSLKKLKDLRLYPGADVQMLRDMTASGQLEPLNRQPEWTRKLARIYSTLVIFFLVIFNILLVFMVVVLPWSGLLGINLHFGWRGILYTLEELAYYPLHIHWLFFPILLISMSTLDQIVFATALKRMVTKLADEVAANRVDPTRGLATRRLLRVLIQYRLLKRQLSSTKAFVRFIAASMISAILLAPALARIYASRLPAWMRPWYMSYCLFWISIMNTFIVPTCYLHARCLELYRALAYLTARLDAASHHLDQMDRTSTIAIDGHTLSLLRRELHVPELVVRQFATDAHFMQLTYSNMMAVNFYCGLWLVPMLMRDTSGLDTGTSNFLGLL